MSMNDYDRMNVQHDTELSAVENSVFFDSYEGFRLNMRILADAMERENVLIEYYEHRDLCRLSDVRMYYEGQEIDGAYVYIVSPEDAPHVILEYPQISWIINGVCDRNRIDSEASIILLLEEENAFRLLERVQAVFALYRNWDWEIRAAVDKVDPLDAVLEASVRIFRNPIFMHDTNFFILSDPHHVSAMSDWERDPRTGRDMVSMATINDFRTDLEYLNGLKTNHPVMFSQNQTGYRILFRNLWNEGHYEGRVLIDEVENAIQPGDYYALEYLGRILEQYVRQKKIVWLSMGNDVEEFFVSFFEEGHVDERQAITYLQYLGWKHDDGYYCLRVITEQKEFNLLSSNAILGQIDMALSNCISFYYNNSITVVINSTCSGYSIAEAISKLAAIIRDGLLKVGISALIQNFNDLPKAYEQARIALDYGRISNSMYWYYYFSDYTLDFILDCADRAMPIELLSSDALRKLRKYDEENHSDLYHTLEIYLRFEKNVLRTSKELFIHRSTLAYRLERIQKMINVDLDDPKQRLKLLISYYMEESMRR